MMDTSKAKPNSSSSSRLPRNAKKLSISILVISLPILYVSLLRIPPSTLFNDTTFWFLISNSIIIIVAADSCMFSSPNEAAGDLHDEFIKHSTRTQIIVEEENRAEQKHAVSQSETVVDKSQKSVNQKLASAGTSAVSMKEMLIPPSQISDQKPVVKISSIAEEIPLLRRTSVTEKRIDYGVDDDEYSKMPIEELNKRVEEFIRRFNREMRLELRNE